MPVQVITGTALFFREVWYVFLLWIFQITVGFNISIPFQEMGFCRYCSNVTSSISGAGFTKPPLFFPSLK